MLLYLRDEKIREVMRQEKKYSCTVEKAHGQLEKGGITRQKTLYGWRREKSGRA